MGGGETAIARLAEWRGQRREIYRGILGVRSYDALEQFGIKRSWCYCQDRAWGSPARTPDWGQAQLDRFLAPEIIHVTAKADALDQDYHFNICVRIR